MTPCTHGLEPHTTRTGLPACAGHSKTGKCCHNPPMAGQKVCRLHGGGAPQNRAAGARRQAEAEAARQVATLGLPVDITPTEALLEEVRWTAGHVQWLRAKVQELQAQPSHKVTSLTDGEDLGYGDPTGIGALTWGTTKITTGDTAGTTQEAKPSIWYVLYTQERAHLVTVCTAALKAGVEERRVRLAEQQGDLVAEVIRRILDALNLTPEQLELVPVVVPQQLRLIAGGTP